MRYPINPADFGEPYEYNAEWCVDEALYPVSRGYKVHRFTTEAEAKKFIDDNEAAYNAQKLQEVSGVAVCGENSDRQAALEALNTLGDSSTLPDEQRNELEMAIRAALTAKPYIVNISEEEATALLQDATPGEISYVSNADLTAQDVNAELKAKLEKAKWQPIETAPKDGKSILVTDGFEVCDAYFRGGDWWQYECGDDWYSTSINPTHWMPLPDAPEQH